MLAHSRYAPSSAERWVPCTGSLGLSEQFPQLTVDPSAAEGEAAHWVAQQFAESVPVEAISSGMGTPNGVLVTDEMIEGGLLYFETLRAICDDPRRWRLEQREYMPSIHPEAFGTPDCSINMLELDSTIHVVDYKFGFTFVDEYRNWQIADYFRGILDRLQITGLQEQHIKLVFHLVQPRCYSARSSVRSWTTMAVDLRDMWNQLHMAANTERPTFVVGTYCEFCPGRRACPALNEAAGRAKAYAGREIPAELPPEALGRELRFAERQFALLEARVSGLREQAQAICKSGQRVPFYGMESGRSSIKWNKPDAEVIALGTLLSVDLQKVGVVTPTQAKEKLKRAGVDGSVISAYSEHIPGALQLRAVNENATARIFENGN